MTTALRVGFVGAGQMGGPMVERLLAAGIDVHLFARRPQVRERFAGLGAVVEESVAALARSAGILIACPFSEDQLLEIAAGADGLIANAAPGTVIVQHATVSVGAIARLAADASTRGVAVLDAPVSGTDRSILAGQLTVLAGGDPAAREQAEPALLAYSAIIVATGGVGSATKVKLVNNLLFAAHTQTGGAAVRLGRDLGIEPGELLAALTACSASSFALSMLREVGDVDRFAAAAAPYLRKDVALVERVAGELGLDTGLLGDIVRAGPFAMTGPDPVLSDRS
jgi:3-hydroxyisobutyrate dehydrogenase-like beta-hydroxyacid dehydrogenase